MALANDGNFREMRYFTPWEKARTLEKHQLPDALRELTGQRVVDFGDGVLEAWDTTVGAESCEELWVS